MDGDRYGAAVHEAGHAVVARAFGVTIVKMIVGINGNEGKGEVETADVSHLSVVERVAICAGGIEAQDLLHAPTPELVSLVDECEIMNILADHDEAEGITLRQAGFDKAAEVLELHRTAVERLAAALAEHGELEHNAIERIIANAV